MQKQVGHTEERRRRRRKEGEEEENGEEDDDEEEEQNRDGRREIDSKMFPRVPAAVRIRVGAATAASRLT